MPSTAMLPPQTERTKMTHKTNKTAKTVAFVASKIHITLLRILACALILALIWTSGSVHAQTTNPQLNLQVAAEETMPRSESPPRSYRDGLRIRRLRATGWVMLALGTTAAFVGAPFGMRGSRSEPDDTMFSDDLIDFSENPMFYNPDLALGLLVSGAFVGLHGAALLLAARIKVNRRRRREQASPRYFQLSADLGVSPSGLRFDLRF